MRTHSEADDIISRQALPLPGRHHYGGFHPSPPFFRARSGPAEEAEPLMRRALAIAEKSYGPEHPEVAGDLNNLALLLKATNRLEEAEPLMRRVVIILLKFTRKTGHLHPHIKAVLADYWETLEAMSLGEEEIGRRIAEVGKEAGFDEQSLPCTFG